MKYYNELEQSWRKLNQDHPEVAKAIEESDHIEKLSAYGAWRPYVDTGFLDDGIFRAPIKTEAEKFLEKWKGKKIWQEGMQKHAYHLVTGALDHNTVHVKNQDGKCRYIVLRAADNWQLWESPIKLDTRRVAGWWAYRNDRSFFYQVVPSCDGETLLLDKVQFSEEHGPLESLTFSQDPMKPLDQWQTLEEICGGES